MTTATNAKRWDRWTKGRFRLHLATGGTIEFVGRLRIQHDADNATDYEVDADSLLMPPRFSAVESIEQIATRIV